MLSLVFLWILHSGARRPALVMQCTVMDPGLERENDLRQCVQELSGLPVSHLAGTMWVLSIQAFTWEMLGLGAWPGETVKEVVNQPPAFTSC